MLRGPQTPGELKQRTERMHAFADLAGVHDTLAQLIERGLVARLERRPGHKEERYKQLLQSGNDEQALAYESTAEAPPRAPVPEPAGLGELDGLRERVEQLEREVALLREEIRHPAAEMQP
jgi:hypothetical protein